MRVRGLSNRISGFAIHEVYARTRVVVVECVSFVV